MNNLINTVTQDNKKVLRDFKTFLNEQDTIETILNRWQFKNLMTPAKFKKNWTKGALKTYLVERKELALEKSSQKTIDRINLIADTSKEIKSMSIVVEWRKNRTWGANPKAFLTVYFKDNSIHEFESSPISGCGFDKLSIAVGETLNQCNELLKLMYVEKNRPKNKNKESRHVFGYGSGYALPYFQGGVGISCYPRIFEKLGFKFETMRGTNSVDIYKVERLK